MLAYILELEKWGYEEWDGPCSFHSEIADRLRDLREIQDAWQNPKPRFDGTKTTKLPIKSQLNPANSAQVGVCVNGVYLRRTTTGNPRAPERDVLVDLFKISNDPNNHESTSFRLDFDFTQHYLDVNQKLFVVVKNEK